jgi:hypothetical protein
MDIEESPKQLAPKYKFFLFYAKKTEITNEKNKQSKIKIKQIPDNFIENYNDCLTVSYVISDALLLATFIDPVSTTAIIMGKSFLGVLGSQFVSSCGFRSIKYLYAACVTAANIYVLYAAYKNKKN